MCEQATIWVSLTLFLSLRLISLDEDFVCFKTLKFELLYLEAKVGMLTLSTGSLQLEVCSSILLICLKVSYPLFNSLSKTIFLYTSGGKIRVESSASEICVRQFQVGNPHLLIPPSPPTPADKLYCPRCIVPLFTTSPQLLWRVLCLSKLYVPS